VRSPDLLDRIAPELPPFWLSPDRGEEAGGPAFALDPPVAAPEEASEPFLTTNEVGEPAAQASPDTTRDRPVESARRKLWPLTLAASITLHLLPLALLLLAWPIAPAEVAAPIPVQLVVEQPKPPPPARPAPAPEKRRPPGRLASQDMGNPAAKERRSGPEPEPSTQPQQPEKMGDALPLVKPSPEPPPEPADQPQQQAMLPLPALPAVPRADAIPPEARRQQAKPRLPQQRQSSEPSVIHFAGAWTRLPAHLGALGPAATADPYLAECNAMILQHIGLVSPAFIGDRRGSVVIGLSIFGDGRIARVSVVQSSGYPDIDARVEKMIIAVARFPPVPQRFQWQIEGEQMGMSFFASFDRSGLIR
jgi:TonB family protein